MNDIQICSRIKKEENLTRFSSFPTVLSQQFANMCIFCLSYFDNSPPTLNFKQDIVVQDAFHFLLAHRVHQQLFE